jgi:hypothetical protein
MPYLVLSNLALLCTPPTYLDFTLPRLHAISRTLNTSSTTLNTDYHSSSNPQHYPFISLNIAGWEDVSLAREGVMEAQAAGKLLKAHGFTFDVVYTRYFQAMHSTVHSCFNFQLMCAWAFLMIASASSDWLGFYYCYRISFNAQSFPFAIFDFITTC